MTPVVELQQVSSGVLRGLDVLAYPGERVGVMAEAGAGKSVLAELLVGVRLPRRGRVRRDGRDVTRRTQVLEPATAAPGVGWVAQPSRPFPRLSVYENVLVAASVRGRSSRLAEGHTRRALERLGLLDHANQLPAELDLSRAVRLDVARVVAAPRRLIVVDQLADRVDDAVRRLVTDVLDESVATGSALVWLEGPDQPPRAVDRLLVLAYGRIAQEGPPEQVLATPHFRRPATAPRGSDPSGHSPTDGPAAAPPGAPAATATANGAPSPPPGHPPAGPTADAETGARPPSEGAGGAPVGATGAGATPAGATGAGATPAGDPGPSATGDAPAESAPPGADSVAAAPTGSPGALGADPTAVAEGPSPAAGGRRRQPGRRGRGRYRGGQPGQPALAVEGWVARPGGRAIGPDATGIDLRVVLGEVVALTSPTAATTSLLLSSLAGLVDAEGTLVVGGRDLTGASAAARARAGLAFVPQEGGVADGLTVDEHLSLAGARRWRRRWTKGAIFGLFPSLAAARQRPAGGLPSLERRCLAVARALVTDPQVVLVDEPVRGVVTRSTPVVLQALAVVARTAAVVLAERPDGPALVVADRVVDLGSRPRWAPAEPAGAAR